MGGEHPECLIWSGDQRQMTQTTFPVTASWPGLVLAAADYWCAAPGSTPAATVTPEVGNGDGAAG